MDGRGEVVAVHGSSDFEVVQSLASKQASLSEAQRQSKLNIIGFTVFCDKTSSGLQ